MESFIHVNKDKLWPSENWRQSLEQENVSKRGYSYMYSCSCVEEETLLLGL